MKAINATVITQMDAEQARPVTLISIGLSNPLYYAASKAAVVFPTLGQSYAAKAIQFDKYQQDIAGNLTRIKIRFDNVSKDMAAYATVFEFVGAIINIKRVYRDALGSALFFDEIFNGPVESYSLDYYWMEITARDGSPLSARAPKRTFQKKCPWIFGGTECNRDGYSDLIVLKATGTADSGSTTTLIDNVLTQADDYWNYGLLTCTKSGVTESRIVSDFDAAADTATVGIPFSFTINNATTYTILKGCDKTTTICGAATSYGPSADNINNFGGFPLVGKRPSSALPGFGGYHTQVEQVYDDVWRQFNNFDFSQL